MTQTGTQILKWTSLPLLLTASVFSAYAGGYEPALNLAICLGAAAMVHRAFCTSHYFWAAGLVAIAVVFSPLALAIKIFLLMGFTCAGTFATLVAAFRAQPVPVLETSHE
jgi:hypothetical protein